MKFSSKFKQRVQFVYTEMYMNTALLKCYQTHFVEYSVKQMLLLISVKFEKWRGAGNNVIPGTASITQETKLVIILFGNISSACADLRIQRLF